jgi:hypothetical protein
MSIRKVAEGRLNEVLEKSGARDPRELSRDTLRRLRDNDADAYQRAVSYFENVLLVEITREDSDPLDSWLEYSRFLASLRTVGTAVQIDRTGRSFPYSRPVPGDHLVLYLPTSGREPALPVSLPIELSLAQQATYDLLVNRKVG